ncbi:hypothetical protein B0H14DRAFT_22316 [Mycena olivaceomarginata]|nr:hypothetical protein B0H14DRAFT_22316 [Mycena olivaceomarginata]
MRGHGISLALLVVRVASQTGTSNCNGLHTVISMGEGRLSDVSLPLTRSLLKKSINNKNQTPCLVAAFLESVVKDVSGELLGTGFRFDTIPLRLPVAEVNSIPVGTHYIGPSPANATPCQCSTVTYSLVSACGGCQERNFLSWTDWAANCREVEVGRFLEAVPTQVIVPSWAYLDVTTTNNTFNPILANQSLSTSGPSSSASISPSTSSTAPPSTSSVSLPSSPTTPQKSNSNAGPIAGGVVVGGLVVAVAAGLAILFYLRRRNRTHEDRHLTGAFSTSGPSMDSRTAASLPPITPYNYGMFPKETDISEAGDTFPGSPVTSAGHTTYDTRSVSTPAIEVLHRYTGSGEI